MSDVVPRCSHGNIILGCPDDDCPEQNEYVRVMNARYIEYYKTLLPSRVELSSDAPPGQ